MCQYCQRFLSTVVGLYILYVHYNVEDPLCSSYPTIYGWVATVNKEVNEVWSPRPLAVPPV